MRVSVQWADLTYVRPGPTLANRAKAALQIYPCDLLIVHRDAENQAFTDRLAEIQVELREQTKKLLPIIPVKMTEAWFLIDETSLRRAAGNPNGKVPLKFPKPDRLEAISNPKQVLHDTLRAASEWTGRRAHDFDPHLAYHRLAELIQSYAPLRALTAFQDLERRIGELS